MPNVSENALVVAIQAIDSLRRRYKAEVDADGEDADPDLQEILLSYENTAMELKRAYREAERGSAHLPAYDDLIGA